MTAVLLLTLGCGDSGPNAPAAPARGSLLTSQQLTSGGVQREYHVYVPAQSAAAPLVFLFHGHSNDHNELLGLGGQPAPFRVWLDIAERENVMVVVPKGLFTSSNEKGWNDCRADAGTNSNADDVQFVRDLVTSLVARYGADARRVYASGISNGGHLSIRLGLEAPGTIAAFAAVVAANAVNSKCSPVNTPVAALFLNGTADPLLPYAGGQMAGGRGDVLSAEQTVGFWVQRNGANTTPELSSVPNTNTSDGSTVDRRWFRNPGSGAEVLLVRVVGGGHTAPSIRERLNPSGAAVVGPQNGDLEMAEEIWAFFRDKRR